jgi:hypothetical protein
MQNTEIYNRRYEEVAPGPPARRYGANKAWVGQLGWAPLRLRTHVQLLATSAGSGQRLSWAISTAQEYHRRSATTDT